MSAAWILNLQAAAAPYATLSGTAASGLTEAEIVAGGETIILTLTNDTWVAAGATFDAQRQAIINGITSAQSETLGWNNVVRDAEAVTSVVRTSNTIVTITLSAAATYDITANETITLTVPASAVDSATQLIVGSLITATAYVAPPVAVPAAALTGSLGDGALESDISSRWQRLVITLTDDTFIDPFTTAMRNAILSGMTSSGSGATGWNASVRDAVVKPIITRVSSTVATVDFVSYPAYSISLNETITVTLPATVLTSATAVTATPTILITANGTAGTAITNATSTTDTPNNYAICMRTGFKVRPGDLVNDEGMWVRPESYDGPHPQDHVRPPRPAESKGSNSPEKEDRFLADGEITVDDL